MVSAVVLAVGPPAVADTIGSTATVYTVGAGKSLRAPTITAYDASNLVTAWRDQVDAVQDDAGDALASWSSDGGQTWSGAITLKAANSTYAYVNTIVFKDPGSAAIYAYIGRVPTGTSANEMTLIAMKSTDKGHTWTDQAINVSYPFPTITGGSVVKMGSTYYLPFARGTGATPPTIAGVLKSTDLLNWSLAGTVPNPDAVALQEGQLAVDQSSSSTLVMQMRVQGAYTYRSTSSDGGATWTAAAQDIDIPSGGTKGFFGKDSNGTDIAIYGPVDVPNPNRRQGLYYKTKKPGEPWGPERFFADQPANPALPGFGPGWDTYPNAVEVSPGVWKVVWEFNTAQPKVAQIDVSDTFNGVAQPWNSTTGWTANGAGTAAISPAGQLHLADSSGAPTALSRTVPALGGFAVTLRDQISSYTANAPTTGVSLGLKVATGTRRLMLAFQGDGVYAITSVSTPGWARVYTAAGSTTFQTWKVVSDSTGQTSLSNGTGGPVVAAWQTPTNASSPTFELFGQGSASQPADAHVDYSDLSLPMIGEEWPSAAGWSPIDNGGAADISPAGQLHLLSNNGSSSLVTKLAPGLAAPYYLEFSAKVDHYSTTDPTVGTTVLVKVAGGSKRLMLAMQSDGIWAITNTSSPNWTRVLALTGDTAWHTWSVRVDESGTTRVFRDGVSLGLSWDLAANATTPEIQLSSHGSSAQSAEAHIDFTRLIRPWF